MDNIEQELYDEFGNYIGPDLDSDDSSDEESSDEESASSNNSNADDQSAISEMDVDRGALTLAGDGTSMDTSTAAASSSIVLHEDKVHYPSAATVFGPNVTTAILDEDAMDISEPILPPEPTLEASHAIHDPNLNDFGKNQRVSDEYLTALCDHGRTKRGVALVGNLSSGKTTFVDLLLSHTLYDASALRIPAVTTDGNLKKQNSNNTNGSSNTNGNNSGQKFYTDTRKLEQLKKMSLQSTPITLPLSTSHKTHAITILDNPGHVQFHDESVATLRLVDGAILLVDIIEAYPLTLHDEMLLKQIIHEGLPVILVLNKCDRLIVDLKLPVEDAYYKIRSVLDGINAFLNRMDHAKKYPRFCPTRNVAFSSAEHGWVVTLEGMAEMYVDHVDNGDHGYDNDDDNDIDDDDEDDHVMERFGSGVLGHNLTVEEFTRRLWGDCYLDPKSRTFQKKQSNCIPASSTPRTFCQFVLEPIYKIYSACLGESEKDVSRVLRSVGVHLSRDVMRSCSRTLLRAALEKFFVDASGFVNLIVKNVPTPSAAAIGKISRCYTGSLNTSVSKSMLQCNPNGPLMIHVTKLYAYNRQHHPAGLAGQTFSALGRIYSGSVKAGDRVRVLGEAYSMEDDEDMAFATVESVAIPRGRYRTEVTIAKAGSWVLLDGVDANIAKTATITGVKKERAGYSGGDENEEDENEIEIFAPLKFPQTGGESVMKLSVEPLNPSELPKMVEGLRRISKSYPMVRTRVEESGEHVLFGTGELYMDCVMHDLRHVYSDIEVKVADPVVGFRETVVETSSIKCFSETANKRNKLTMIAEPLDEGLAEQLEKGKVNPEWDGKKLGRYFQSKFDWDLLSARSVWAFGDSPTHGPNILMDDTLPSEVDKRLLTACKSGIVQGFQWATREGPLCEEPVRATKLKILDTILADKPIHRGAGQIIPTARCVVHSSLLTASPRLMEPVYRVEIQCQGDIVDGINPLLNKRRGHIVQDRPVPGSPLYRIKAFLPVIDSFGFETDIRTFTQGQAMVHSVFDHWAIVPGDPLDRNVILHPLEPSPPQCLARDFLIKTRRRKGLSEDVSLVKFFDEGMQDQLES